VRRPGVGDVLAKGSSFTQIHVQLTWDRTHFGDDDTAVGSFASDMSMIGPVVAGGAGIGVLSVIFSLSALCCRAKPQDCPSMCSLVTAAIAAFIAGVAVCGGSALFLNDVENKDDIASFLNQLETTEPEFAWGFGPALYLAVGGGVSLTAGAIVLVSGLCCCNRRPRRIRRPRRNRMDVGPGSTGFY